MSASVVSAPRALVPAARERATGWLRNPAFDLTFVFGVLALAFVVGGAALLVPPLFGWIVYADFWLLAYPHVVSTFTRVAFDRESARRHWFLLLGLPPIVFLATASATWLGGVIALNTIYFYGQTYHYTRQSYGIARAYRRAGGASAFGRDRLTDVVVFAFPIWGLLHRAHQQQPKFYASPIWNPPVPQWLVLLAGGIAMLSLSLWTARTLRAIFRGAAPAYALFVLSHVAVTVVSYVAIAEITYGWLVINLWHNAQYLLFVWAHNARQFRAGVDDSQPLLSRMSQPDRVGMYAAVCLGLSATVYMTLGQATSLLSNKVLPLVLICHQTVNFHHYLVDAVIWRTPRAR